MATISWGKPKLWLAKLVNGTPSVWKPVPTPADGTTQLNTTKGEKKEAKIEGGEVEAVKYNRNNFSLEFIIRALGGREKLAPDDDGVIEGEYALKLQPEDPTVTGLYIPRGVLSFEPTYNAADGVQWKYTLDALVPEDTSLKSVNFQVITDPTTAGGGE